MRKQSGFAAPGRAMMVAGLAAVAVFTCGAPASAQLAVEYRDGDIGGNLDFVLQAPPGSVYLNVLALTEGPTCFPPKHPVGCIDVDLVFLSLSFQLPGFFGTMGPSGELVASFAVPADPALDGIVVNDQLIEIVSGKLTAKSELCKIVLGAPASWSLSLGTMAGDPLAVPAIELDDGRVLMAGAAGANLDQCELYDPWLQAFTTTDPLAEGRAGHTVTKLQDGRVLVVGGSDINVVTLATAELFDPATDTWSSVGSLAGARAGHTANLLPDGRVLVAGGSSDVTDPITAAANALKTCEYFDPVLLTFSAGPALARPHVAQTSVSLANGDVLLGGGATFTKVLGIPIPDLTAKAQLFIASSSSWSAEKNMKAARVGANSILLADGRALIVGGIGGSITSLTVLDSSETFDPVAVTFSTSGTMSQARVQMTLLRFDGTDLILAAGGGTDTNLTAPLPTDVVEIWDPVTGLFTVTASLPSPRAAAGGLIQENHHAILFGGAGVASPAAIYHD